MLIAVLSPHAGATAAHQGRSVRAAVCAAPAAEVHVAGLAVDAGQAVATATFTLAADCAATDITLASYEAPSASFGVPQTLFKSATVTAKPGSTNTLRVAVPSCFYQVDLVTGSALQNVSATNLYGARKIAFLNGGTKSCSAATPPPPPATCPTSGARVIDGGLKIANGLATGTFSIAAGCSGVQVSLATYRTPSASFSLPQTLYQGATGTYGAGGPYTLTAPVPPCFYQVDLVTGPVLPVVDADHLYGARKIAFLNGGSPCAPPPPPPPTTSTAPAPTPPPPSSTTTPTTTSPITDVSITKTPNRHDFAVGDVIVYTLVVKNAGPSVATDVTVVEDLPTQISFISATPSVGSCTAGTVVTCSLGTLAVGASSTITLEARAIATGTAVNTATVTTSTPETTTTNNRATATVTIHASFTPPKVTTKSAVCASLTVVHSRLRASRPTVVVVRVRDAHGHPLAGARVVAHGAGVLVSARSSHAGVVRLHLRPRVPGVVELSVSGGVKACTGVLRVTPQVFLPPKPTFTG